MKKSELRQLIREEIQALNEASYSNLKWSDFGMPEPPDSKDEYYIELKSAKGFTIDLHGYFFNMNNDNEEYKRGSAGWKKIYKKLSSKDKKLTNDLLKKWAGL